MHTGGVCFGYSTVPVGESGANRLVKNVDEARIVLRIFGMYASGLSFKGISKNLNSELVPPPRSKSHSGTPTWCPTAIREMLRRRLYMGEKLWNCSQFKKVPGTNTRRSRPRPESEWTRISLPELAMVSSELWDAVQTRLQSVRHNGGNRTRLGLLPRGLTSRYLFSNFLKCGKCGNSLIIQTSGSRKRKYACPGFVNRGTCKNNLYIPQEEVESVLLANLKDDLLRPESMAFVVAEFGDQLRASLESLSGNIAQWRSRKEKLEREIKNFTDAIAEGGYSKSMVEAIGVRKREIGDITDRLLSSSSESIEGLIAEIRSFVDREIQNLSALLNANSPLVKPELHRHLSSVTMHPVGNGREWHYEAEGAWNLLGEDKSAPREEQAAQNSDEGHLRMVAGAGFEPATFGL